MRIILVRYNSGAYNYLDFFHYDGNDLTLERSVHTSINVYGIAFYQGRIAITDGTKLQMLNKDGSLAVTKNWSPTPSGMCGITIRGNRLFTAPYSAPYFLSMSLTDDFYYTPANVIHAKGGNGLASKLNQFYGTRTSKWIVYSQQNQERALSINDQPYAYRGIDILNGQIIGEDIYTENLMSFQTNFTGTNAFPLVYNIGTFGSVKVMG